jgi:hypothetical protein
VPHRPLVFVSALTVGDYLLWNWSLSGNHDVLALVSGFTVPPLVVACLWLLVLNVTRLAGHLARRRTEKAARGRSGAARGRRARASRGRARAGARRKAGAAHLEKGAGTGTGAERPSRKIAA